MYYHSFSCVGCRDLQMIGGGWITLCKGKDKEIFAIWVPAGVALVMTPKAMQTSHRSERLLRPTIPIPPASSLETPEFVYRTEDKERFTMVTDFALSNCEKYSGRGKLEHAGEFLDTVQRFFSNSI